MAIRTVTMPRWWCGGQTYETKKNYLQHIKWQCQWRQPLQKATVTTTNNNKNNRKISPPYEIMIINHWFSQIYTNCCRCFRCCCFFPVVNAKANVVSDIFPCGLKLVVLLTMNWDDVLVVALNQQQQQNSQRSTVIGLLLEHVQFSLCVYSKILVKIMAGATATATRATIIIIAFNII